MSLSIPRSIHTNFTPFDDVIVKNELIIGSSVKDLASGCKTTMQQANERATEIYNKKFKLSTNEAHNDFNRKKEKFEKDFAEAKINASKAENLVESKQTRKIIALSLLSTAIIFSVGLILGSALLTSWPLALIAAPFVIAIVPTSYYSYIFSRAVSDLQSIMQRPQGMQEPLLRLPSYHPPIYEAAKDLDLKESRISAQNKLSSLKNLSALAKNGFSQDDIINYALLDRMTVIKPENRPIFYAKCLQLINTSAIIEKENKNYKNQANKEHNKLVAELNERKRKEERELATQKRQYEQLNLNFQLQNNVNSRTGIAGQRQSSAASTVLHTAAHVYNQTMTQMTLNSMKTDIDKKALQIESDFNRKQYESSQWHMSTLNDIAMAYQKAQYQLEMQFNEIKVAAAA